MILLKDIMINWLQLFFSIFSFFYFYSLFFIVNVIVFVIVIVESGALAIVIVNSIDVVLVLEFIL